eukprot:gnl/MRDRNA2_/MRDRNA2_74540_c0_seq2.p1 gnl/MRDRNA2_/MRDRNA2_74540_c0~~gnl/MRDRNA2_/MRDRNA2_74540_c0_seq2.p1  ORF type:complete len:169 (+),score=32.24 gnl/MRDRNA2_/MRDRNA2_74540_c0_seq2:24-530(+)
MAFRFQLPYREVQGATHKTLLRSQNAKCAVALFGTHDASNDVMPKTESYFKRNCENVQAKPESQWTMHSVGRYKSWDHCFTKWLEVNNKKNFKVYYVDNSVPKGTAGDNGIEKTIPHPDVMYVTGPGARKDAVDEKIANADLSGFEVDIHDVDNVEDPSNDMVLTMSS